MTRLTAVKATDGRAGHLRRLRSRLARHPFEKSFNVLAKARLRCAHGQSSGPLSAWDPQQLGFERLFLKVPGLVHYIAARHELVCRAGKVVGWIRRGERRIRIGATFSLADAAQAYLGGWTVFSHKEEKVSEQACY